MDFRGELQLASKCICGETEHLSPEEATLCKRINDLTKERDELISEERELEMTLKQRKESGKNIKARVKSILNHPSAKTIATELTPFSTLEKRKRNVSASLTILGRQLVTLDQQIINQRDESLAELDKKEYTTQNSQRSVGSIDESFSQITVQLLH